MRQYHIINAPLKKISYNNSALLYLAKIQGFTYTILSHHCSLLRNKICMLDKMSKQNTSNLRHSLEEKNMWIIDCIYQNLTILVIYPLIISLPGYNLSSTEFSFEKMPKLLLFESFWPNLVIVSLTWLCMGLKF